MKYYWLDFALYDGANATTREAWLRRRVLNLVLLLSWMFCAVY